MRAVSEMVAVNYALKKAQIESRIRNLTANIAHYTGALAGFQIQLDEHEADKARFTHMRDTAMNALLAAGYKMNHRPVVMLHTELKKLQPKSEHIGQVNLSIHQHREEIARITPELINKRRELSVIAAKENTTITLRELKQQLKGIAKVNARNARMYISKDDEPVISWSYKNIIMQVRTNMPGSATKGPIYVPLGNIMVTINPETNKIRIKSDRSRSNNSLPRGFNGNPVVHPHVLRGNDPCLGDFGGSLMEQLTERDFGSAAIILLKYLESCDPNDSAGTRWKSFITLPPGTHSKFWNAEYLKDNITTRGHVLSSPDGRLRVIECQNGHERPNLTFQRMVAADIDYSLIDINGKNHPLDDVPSIRVPSTLIDEPVFVAPEVRTEPPAVELVAEGSPIIDFRPTHRELVAADFNATFNARLEDQIAAQLGLPPAPPPPIPAPVRTAMSIAVAEGSNQRHPDELEEELDEFSLAS